MSLLLDALNKAQRQTENKIEPDKIKSDAGDLSEIPDLDIDAYTVSPPKPNNSTHTNQHSALQHDDITLDSENNPGDIHSSINYEDIALFDDVSPPNDPPLNLDPLSLESATLSSNSFDKNNVDQLDIETDTAIPSPSPIHQSIHDGVLADLEADLQRVQSPVEIIESPKLPPKVIPTSTAPTTQSTPSTLLTSTIPTKPAVNTSRASARRLFKASAQWTPKGRNIVYAFAAITTIGMLAGTAYVLSITQDFQTPVRLPAVPHTQSVPSEDLISRNNNPEIEAGTTHPVGLPQPELLAEPGVTLPLQSDHATLTMNKPSPLPTSGMTESTPPEQVKKTSIEEDNEEFSEESLPDFDTVAESQLPPSPASAQTRDAHPAETTAPTIRVTRATAPAQVSEYVAQAYTAFQYGEWQTAYNQYQNALREEPNNRDAMLGLAAIATHQNNAPLARSYYSKLLQFNGNDAIAIAGLQGVAPTTDTSSSESELKSLIAKTPDAPYLHFALGNVYVQQQRWPDAERAFFVAYRQDKNHPDYAYNLAICLDHLGQSSPALHYYETALSLAMSQTAGFDVEQAKQRISDLRRVIRVPSP